MYHISPLLTGRRALVTRAERSREIVVALRRVRDVGLAGSRTAQDVVAARRDVASSPARSRCRYR